MQAKSDLQRGWEFASRIVGADMAASQARSYVTTVNDAINTLEQSLRDLRSDRTIPSIGGDAAEQWHANTFNIDAVAADSSSKAEVLTQERHAKWSTDVRLTKEDGSTEDYGLKYRKYYNQTADDQSLLDVTTREPGYKGQKRLVPSDQKDAVIKYSSQKAQAETRSDVANAYEDTSRNTVDRVTDGQVSSKPLSKDEDLEIARELKEDRIDLEKHGISTKSAIKTEYIVKQAIKAGLSAASITIIMQTAPEIFKAIDYLIKNGELDINQIKYIGTKAVTSGAEGFLRGSIACTLKILCDKGAFGNALKGIDPTLLGTAVALTIETIKNSIYVAAGKMQPREMGDALVDSIIVSGGYVVGMNIGSAIGGVIGQAIGFELPFVGYVLGSLIGTAFSVVYNIGKKKLISFCVDTGFTCFGLVEQDYKLPEEVLKELGIDTIPISRTEVSHIEVGMAQVGSSLQRVNYETINLKMVKRGIIGVNKVGYVFA